MKDRQFWFAMATAWIWVGFDIGEPIAGMAVAIPRPMSALAADDNWHAWLLLLAQVETAIQAVEAVVEEGSRG